MAAPVRAPSWRPGATPARLAERAAFLASIRAFMAGRGVLEVDTALIGRAAPSERALECMPVEQGGYLVSSPEHGLKRLLAAGLGSIYQLGHVFRQGEVGRWHNPEFCMLEWYRPQASLDDAIAECGALIEQLTGQALQPTLDYAAVFSRATGLDPVSAPTDRLFDYAYAAGIAPVASDLPDDCDRAFWLDLIMGLIVQPELGRDGPVAVRDFPSEDAVLVASKADNPAVARRFEVFWQGIELANGAEELTDADLARQRMAREMRVRAARGQPQPPVDEALLAAMTAGLPACAGVALGVDRLFALAVGAGSLAEAMAFDWSRR